MTREKTVRNLLTELIDMIDNGSQRNLDRADEIGVSIIKLFEQEPILDKIRVEIKAIAFDWQEIDGEHESFMVVDLNDALNIIDKYKAETEET